MSDIDFEWSDGDPEEFARKLAEVEETLMEYLEEAMKTAVLLVESTAKELVPVDSGRLRSSIASEVEKVATNVIKGLVGTNVEYAKYVEFGTSSHMITADSGYLHFTVDGEEVFTKSVNHPGTEAQPFLRPAIETHRDDIIELFEAAVEDAIDEVS